MPIISTIPLSNMPLGHEVVDFLSLQEAIVTGGYSAS